jgi:hypothetical protein
MKKITADALNSNMILARDITSTTGNILLGKGTSLTPALGRRLKNWGINFVYIEGDEESLQKEKVVEVSAEDVKAQLREKFAGHLDDEIMLKLFNAVFEFNISRKRN